MTAPPNLSEEDRQLVLGALDSLGLALTEHGHTWTEGEREIYEQAVAILGRPVADDDEDDDSTEYRKEVY